jgi:hypothetical protein
MYNSQVRIPGGGGGVSFIDREKVKPVVTVSRIRYEKDKEIMVTVTGIEEV